MIAHITGVVTHKIIGALVVDVHGIGYKIRAPLNVIKDAKERATIRLWTHLTVREDVLELYGFEEEAELDFFELLIGISGIGPKSALGILNLAPIEQLKRAIAAGDTHYLTKVSGIGKKNAGKIIVELKDTLRQTGEKTDALSLREEEDALLALTSLGYSTVEARAALRDVKNKNLTTGEKVKAALKLLS